MNNAEARKRKIDLLVRDINRQLKMAADAKISVSLEIEDISKPSDKVKRVRLHTLEEDDDSSSNRPVNKNATGKKDN